MAQGIEEKDLNSQGQGQQTQTNQLTGTGQGNSSIIRSLPPTGGQRLRQPGTGFTNINRILQANQGNRLGSAVQGGIQQAAQGVRQGIQQGQQQYQNQLQQAQQQRQSDINFRENTLQNVAQGQGVSDEDINRFSQLRSGQYQGKVGLDNPELLRQQAMEAEQLGGLIGSEGGRQTLLQRFAGSPTTNYTQGQQRLDALLLGDQGQQLRRAAAGASGLTGAVNTTVGVGQNLAKMFSDQAQALGSETRKMLDTQTGQVQKSAEDLLKSTVDTEVAKQQEIENLRQALGKGQLSTSQAMQLGGQGLVDFIKQGQYLYGLTPVQLVQKYFSTTSPTALPSQISDVMDVTTANKLNALSRLSGGENLYDPTKVGQFKGSERSFDFNKMLSDINAAKGGVEEEYAKRMAGAGIFQAETGKAPGATLADELRNLKTLGMIKSSDIASLTPDQLSGSLLKIGETGRDSSSYQAAQARLPAAQAAISKTISDTLSQVDQNARAQYAADPSLKEKYPNFNDFLGEQRINALSRVTPSSIVGDQQGLSYGGLLNNPNIYAPTANNIAMMQRYIQNLSPSAISDQLAALRGGKLTLTD